MIKLIAINTDVEPVETRRHDVHDDESLTKTILNLLNEMGKNSHVLAGIDGELWQYSHTATRGPSDAFHREKKKYHRFASEVL